MKKSIVAVALLSVAACETGSGFTPEKSKQYGDRWVEVQSLAGSSVKIYDTIAGVLSTPDATDRIEYSSTSEFNNRVHGSLVDRSGGPAGLPKVTITLPSDPKYSTVDLPANLDAWANAVHKNDGTVAVCPVPTSEFWNLIPVINLFLKFAATALDGLHEWQTFRVAKNYDLTFFVDKEPGTVVEEGKPKPGVLKYAEFTRKGTTPARNKCSVWTPKENSSEKVGSKDTSPK